MSESLGRMHRAGGMTRPVHLRLAACRSRSNRSAVRFFAAARDAFFARAERSSAVIVSRLFLPPILPYFCPIFVRYSATSFGIRLAMK